MPLGMTFHCSACGLDVHHVDHEAVRLPDGRRLRISRVDPNFWDALALTRADAIAARRLVHVSSRVCPSRDCGRIMEHERPVLPSVLGWWAGVMAIVATGVLLAIVALGPVFFKGVVASRHGLAGGLVVALIVWVLGMAVVAALGEAAGRWRFKGRWVPIRPERCDGCGGRHLQPLILPRRLRTRAGAGSRGLQCPSCRGQSLRYVGRWWV